jgi:hypothetical protein
MGIESFSQNTKTTKEGIEKPSTLPINIVSGEKHAEGGESDVWKINTQNQKTGEQIDVALKQSKRESFATEEEMQKSKKFYEFLKSFPGFGKFVPDTLYFKAQETKDATPQSYCIQKFTEGERIDRLKDDDIYKDPVLVVQLLELADVSIKILQTAKQDDTQRPDFMRTPEVSSLRVMLAATIFNPRYSSNILVADKPDKNGQRVFFVDVGANANARMQKGWEWNRRKMVNSIIETQFKMWKKKLEKIHASLSK